MALWLIHLALYYYSAKSAAKLIQTFFFTNSCFYSLGKHTFPFTRESSLPIRAPLSCSFSPHGIFVLERKKGAERKETAKRFYLLPIEINCRTKARKGNLAFSESSEIYHRPVDVFGRLGKSRRRKVYWRGKAHGCQSLRVIQNILTNAYNLSLTCRCVRSQHSRIKWIKWQLQLFYVYEHETLVVKNTFYILSTYSIMSICILDEP